MEIFVKLIVAEGDLKEIKRIGNTPYREVSAMDSDKFKELIASYGLATILQIVHGKEIIVD